MAFRIAITFIVSYYIFRKKFVVFVRSLYSQKTRNVFWYQFKIPSTNTIFIHYRIEIEICFYYPVINIGSVQHDNDQPA